VRNKLLPLVFISLLLLHLIATPTLAYIPIVPVLDGDPTDDIWNTGEKYKVPMANQVLMDLTLLYTTENIYFRVLIPHDGPNDVIILNTTGLHDYFGVEFDRNMDGTIHGTDDGFYGPNDIVMVNYFQPGAQDFFSANFRIYPDIEHGGTDNVEGAAGEWQGHLVFEFSKILDSGDRAGYDISLQPGDIYTMMFGFWDDRPVRDANVIVNLPIDGSVFLRFQVNLSPNPLSNILSLVIFLIAVIAVLLFNLLVFNKKFKMKWINYDITMK
jgi:hypothetical protein